MDIIQIHSFIQQVELTYVEQHTCDVMFGGNMIRPSIMCATDIHQGACHGDEGGPLYILVEVYSGSIGCAQDVPGVFARIANKGTWIQNTICNDHSDPKPEFCVSTKLMSKSSPPQQTTHLQQRQGQGQPITHQ